MSVLDLLPQADSVSGHLGSGLLDSIDGLVLGLHPGVGLVHLLLEIVPGVLNAGGLVNNLLDSGAAGLESQHELVLLSRELGVHISHGGALSNGFVNVGLGNGLKYFQLEITRRGYRDLQSCPRTLSCTCQTECT